MSFMVCKGSRVQIIVQTYFGGCRRMRQVGEMIRTIRHRSNPEEAKLIKRKDKKGWNEISDASECVTHT